MENTSQNIVIYCDHLLYPSETFIKAQAGALTRYRAEFAGLRRVPGLELPADRVHVMNSAGSDGQLRELLFKLCKRVPSGFVTDLTSLHPALVHAHFGADGYRALSIAGRLQIPLIVTYHGSDATVTKLNGAKVPFGHRQYLRSRHIVKRRVSHIIAVSQFVRSKLLEQQFPEEKITVHYIGVDTELFSPISHKSPCNVLFVGRLAERKGLEYLIRAMEEIQRQCPEVELVVIGDGSLRSSLEAQARQSLRNYRFLGTQPPDVVREWMGRAGIFAGPSVKLASGEEEAFGMVFAEAQAMAVPVVSFASGGIGEAVEHGATGYLAPERDWKALARFIAGLIRDADLRRQMGKAGRERVVKRFNLKKQTAILEDLYGDVLANASTRRTTSRTRS